MGEQGAAVAAKDIADIAVNVGERRAAAGYAAANRRRN